MHSTMRETGEQKTKCLFFVPTVLSNGFCWKRKGKGKKKRWWLEKENHSINSWVKFSHIGALLQRQHHLGSLRAHSCFPIRSPMDAAPSAPSQPLSTALPGRPRSWCCSTSPWFISPRKAHFGISSPLSCSLVIAEWSNCFCTQSIDTAIFS